MKIIVKTSFPRYSDDQLLNKAQAVINALTGNRNFPATIPSLEVLTNKTTAFGTALANVKTEGKKLIFIKNQLRYELEDTLNSLALHVQQNCNNDANLAMSTGFDIRKDKEFAGIPADC